MASHPRSTRRAVAATALSALRGLAVAGVGKRDETGRG
jgi:hypothetical protein